MGINLGERWQSYRTKVKASNAKATNDFRKSVKKINADKKNYKPKDDPLLLLLYIVMTIPFLALGFLILFVIGYTIWYLLFG